MNSKVIYGMNKRDILNRMLRVSAKHLGVKRIELLDPLLTLFIESLAEEIYKLSTEVDSIETRMLETLSDMICSDISLSAHPSHCILHAKAEESEFILSKETPFILNDKKHLSEKKKELAFYPVCKTKIRNGEIRYVIHNGLCYQVDSDQTKTLIARSRDTELLQKKSYWIGLDLDASIETLENLSIYFDFAGIPNKDEYLSMLPFMTWKLNGKPIRYSQGLHTIKDDSLENVVELFEGFGISEKLDNSILNLYDKHFFTISESLKVPVEKCSFPEELAHCFASHLTEDMTSSLLWIEIEYPSKFNAAIVEAMMISINAFPIANKQLHTKTVEVNEALQVIPLETDNHESLLSIHSIVDAQDRSYYELPFDDTLEKQYCTYSLRRGGYERYSKRELREYLTNLVHLLETHSSAKSGNTSDNEGSREEITVQVHSLVKHIRKVMAKSKEKLEIQNYVLIDKLERNDVFFIKYWTTNCRQADNINQYTFLDYPSSDMSIDIASIFTLSDTTGGKYAPQSTEKQNLRIKSLSKNTLLATDEDIIHFCTDKLKDKINLVTISKGIEESSTKGQGFIQTKDVMLIPKKELKSFWSEDEILMFKQKLQKNSPATFNYRVYINNEK